MLKKLLLGGGVLASVVLLAGAAFLAHTWYARPININLFFAREALQFALQSPETLSSLRVLEPIGIRGHNAKLDNASMTAGNEVFAKARRARDTLLSYRDERLSEGDRMSKRIALSLLDLVTEAEAFRFHNFPLNQLFGVQNGFPSFMESTHQIHSKRDAQDYIARLDAVPTKFAQVMEGLEHREEIGVLPPQFVIDKVLEEMRNFVATPADDNILLVALKDKMSEAALDEDFQTEILAQARVSVERSVYPAYGVFIDYYEQLDAKVEHNYGAWNLPQGDALYRLLLKFFTTTDMTPDEIHALGLREVDRIQAE
ncbi:MAG: DUF885 family protein, partial [Pseudomonadota bacterium]